MDSARHPHAGRRLAGALAWLGAAIFAALIAAHGSVAIVVILVLLPLGYLLPEYTALALVGVLGALPFAAMTVGTAGYNIPVVCALAPVALTAAGTSWYSGSRAAPKVRRAFPPRLLLVGTLLLITGTVSFLFTRGVNGNPDTNEYLKWISLASLFLLPPALGSEWTSKALRVFAVAVAAGGLFAIAGYLAPQLNQLLGSVGYVRTGNDARYFLVGGVQQSVRAAGSYNDPNTAGLVFVLGLAASFVEPVKLIRNGVRAVLLIALVLTLSREAYLGILVAVIALVMAPNVTTGRRAVVAAVLTAGLIALMLNPSTHNRLTGTFSSQDLGSRDRLSALTNFSTTMSGHWEEGFGFGRPEFRESSAAFATNVVADAPLASIYRGGWIEGAGFILWYVYVLSVGLGRLRDGSVSVRALAAGCVAFCTIALAGYGPALIPQEVALLAFWTGCAVTLSGERRSALVSEPRARWANALGGQQPFDVSKLTSA
jgi:hypothetical protein